MTEPATAWPWWLWVLYALVLANCVLGFVLNIVEAWK